MSGFIESYNQNGLKNIDKKDFTEEDKMIIHQCIEADQDPGFRSLENILMRFMDYKATLKYFNPKAQQPNFIALLKELQEDF